MKEMNHIKRTELGEKKVNRRDFLRLVWTIEGISVLIFFGSLTTAMAADVYPADDITFICHSQPGGGYDITARGMAPFLSQNLREVSPGAKGGNVKVKNMTGGAGAKACEYIFKDAKPDGYTIGDFNRGSLYNFLLGGEKLPFDVTKFTFLFSSTDVNRVLVSSTRGPIKTWEDMLASSKKEPLRWAVSTAGGSEHLDTIYVKETTGIPAKITIWGSTSATNAAIIR